MGGGARWEGLPDGWGFQIGGVAVERMIPTCHSVMALGVHFYSFYVFPI